MELRDDLRRHVCGVRADQGPLQTEVVRAGAVAQCDRQRAGHSARRDLAPATVGRAARTRPTRIRCPGGVLDAILLRHVDQEQSRDEIVRAGFAPEVVDRVLRLVRIAGEMGKQQQAAQTENYRAARVPGVEQYRSRPAGAEVARTTAAEPTRAVVRLPNPSPGKGRSRGSGAPS